MKKSLTVLLITTLLASMVSGCALFCEHTFSEANCCQPATCTLCKKTEGELGDHSWEDATCTTPKICNVCGKIEGETLEHTWVDATCKKPRNCAVCGKTDGGALWHDFSDATCMTPKTCSMCKLTLGGLGNHVWIEATAEFPKTCSICGQTEGTALKNYNEITKKVVSGYNDAVNYAKNNKTDVDYAYNDVRDMLVKLNSAAYMNNSEQVKVQYYKLFGDYTGYSIAEMQQQAQDVLLYVVSDKDDILSALMRKFNAISSVAGTITDTEVNIEIKDMEVFVEQMGGLRPQILGGVLAVLNVYDYSWIDDNEPSFLQFTETGFTFHWKATGGYSLNLS